VHRIDFTSLFEVLPGPHNIIDRDLRFVAVNAAYEQATGRSREDLIGRGMFEAFPNSGEAGRRLRQSLERVLETGEADTLAFIRYEIAAADGRMEDRYWTAVHMPIRGPGGAVEFVLQNTVDVTDLQRAQAAAALPLGATPGGTALLQRAQEAERAHSSLLQQSEDFARLFRQAPGFVAVLTGGDHVFTFANDAYLSLVGGRQVVGRTVAEALPEVIDQGFITLLDRVMATGEAVGMTGAPVVLSGPDGTVRETYLDFTYQPIFGAEGAVSGVFVQGADRTEERLAAERQRLLLDELNHRVKNTLATVQSIAAQTLRASPEPARFREAFESRLLALSMAHDLLTASSWTGADLSQVVEGELRPFGPARGALAGPKVRLSSAEALSLAMLFHELATNAAKYGALSIDAGQVAVDWDCEVLDSGDRRLTLRWRERGGPPVAPPTRRGFGSRLIERTATHDLRGTVELAYEAEGLTVRLDLRLDAA
jgi:PAS domain S-box-containing protein